jgi:hypothetical protein
MVVLLFRRQSLFHQGGSVESRGVVLPAFDHFDPSGTVPVPGSQLIEPL